MTSISRSASHLAVSSSPLLRSGASASVSQPSLLAMHRLHDAFAALQDQLARKPQACARVQAAQLAHVCRDIEQAVVETICHLAHGQLGLQALLGLLSALGDDARLPSSRLLQLLAPLDKRMEASLSRLTGVL
ncbi:DUF1484 family protein [Chromobacterium violaceum]|nr:DUF1484 family protein [Chromobacterium violaceum]MBP4043944.1 DUF1484 family protein [Chromobacterium violaceum]